MRVSDNDLVIRIEERLPSPSEYTALRSAVGWKVPTLDDCVRALGDTQSGACAVSGDETLGMGRLIGDGRFYWFIVDVVVHPGHQGCGIGTKIVSTLEAIAARDSIAAVVNLVAAPDVAPFYEHIGYEATGSFFMGKSL